MLPEHLRPCSLLLLTSCFLSHLAPARAAPSDFARRDNSEGTFKDNNKYLPAQIGGIVGAYAISLVLVAIILLVLSKKRRQHLTAANDELNFEEKPHNVVVEPSFPRDLAAQSSSPIQYPPSAHGSQSATSPSVPNFSYPSPIRTDFPSTPNPYVVPSPISSIGAPGVSPLVDQRIVVADRVMAQQQLEDMYKYVMEQEEAKQRGIVLDAPPIPGPSPRPTSDRSSATLSKKEKNKPASLNLNATREEKSQSRASSILSALRSPKKKPNRAISISSPIMTPQSATFPRPEVQEMNMIPPRQYTPAPPPPIPTDQVRYGRTSGAPLTPDMSPQSIQSIDGRIGSQFGPYSHGYGHGRNLSQAPTEADPESATSEHSQVPLVGLPSSPKPGARFPSLPLSPKPGATFQRPNPPSAIRTGGTLPLRAYESEVGSPSAVAHTTKQTVFERKNNPLSPSGNMTPYTAGLPYSPYQPFTPCVPMTPSLVTKDDRKRMKRMMPKTPTLEMVQSSDDTW
jgi:hypothetical protein